MKTFEVSYNLYQQWGVRGLQSLRNYILEDKVGERSLEIMLLRMNRNGVRRTTGYVKYFNP